MNGKEYKRVNWVEGMDVGLQQFEQSEDHFTNALCDAQAVRLNKNNFGLLPSVDGKSDSSQFDISERVTNTVEIKLRRCNAITAGGCRISYNPALIDSMIYTHSFDPDKGHDLSKTYYWDVIISADPFRRIPSGIPDIESTPPHHPDVDSFYGLSITPKDQVNPEQLGMYHLIIGRIRQRGGRYEVDSSFIPPCTSMSSHTDLIRYYELFGSLLNDIERASKIIIAKIRNRTQNSPIAIHIGSLCEDMMRYIATIYFNYRNTGIESTPVSIVNYFSTLAHTCYASLNFINKSEKEELLRYFYEWNDVTPGTFEELLSNTLGIIYNHNDITTIMIQVESFLRILSELWLKLSTLEYIGQHKDNIVVSERVQYQEQPKKAGGWTILD